MSITTDIQDGMITQDEGICGGMPRIAGTRIKVQHIAIEYDRLGMTPDEICNAHPGLTLAKSTPPSRSIILTSPTSIGRSMKTRSSPTGFARVFPDATVFSC
jgi:uncharacterized protein (DUF433 family)